MLLFLIYIKKHIYITYVVQLMLGYGAPVTKQFNVTFLFGPAKTWDFLLLNLTEGGTEEPKILVIKFT